MSAWAFLLQRASAAVLLPLVITHLVVIIIAIQGGLSAEEILTRTRGSFGWGAFYGLFVIAAALHAGIGVQVILQEWSPLGARASHIVGHAFMLALLLLGLRAVYAVVAA